MASIWQEDAAKFARENYEEDAPGDAENIVKLSSENRKDVVVIGGGIAGILCAYLLAESGKNVTLIEAEKICGGVTKRTTAKITANQGIYRKIAGKKRRRMYFQSQQNGINLIEQIVKKHSIDCDFARAPMFVFGGTKDRKKLRKEYTTLKAIGAPATLLLDNNFAIGKYDAVQLGNQAIFDPIKFLQGLPKNFEIIESTRIKKVNLRKKTLSSETRTFHAGKIIFATNFPIVNIRGLYAFKMYKSSSYAINVATEKKLGAMFKDINADGITYRDGPNGIIISGLSHRTARAKVADYYAKLSNFAEIFPGEVTHKWTANDCITFDKIPYAGRHKCLTKDIFILSGFNKWGMASGAICARTVCELALGEKSEFAALFKPSRILHMKTWPKFIFNALCNVAHIAQSFLLPPIRTAKGLRPESGAVVWHRFKKRAVYKDEAGKLFVLDHRCPHMRCELKFNPTAKTWDCPCHGSRLTITGQIINAPTVSSNETKRALKDGPTP